MNATKRKFNALLQGIGSRPTSTVSTAENPSLDKEPPFTTRDSNAGRSGLSESSSNMRSAAPAARLPASSSVAEQLDFLSKRRRIGQPNSKPSAQNPSGTTTKISNVILRKWSGTHGKDNANAPPPRYCPGDRDQLLRRLATFQELTDWTPKPDRINEVEWAKKGWTCQGKERLRCTLCSKELVVKLSKTDTDGKESSILSAEIEDALVDKYVELMVASHQDDCLWRKKGCDDTLLRLPLANPRAAREALRQRYDELCARKDFLPYDFNLRLPDGFDIDAILKNLPSNFFTEPPPPAPNIATTSPNRAALALAVLGWQGLINPKIGAVPNSASCHACLRRLGLWMFKSKEVDPETNTILVPALMDHLDPIREHRFFCPWRNGQVQRNPGGGTSTPRARARAKDAAEVSLPGWEVLVQVLKNDAYLRNRTSTASTPKRASAILSARDGPPSDADNLSARPSTPTSARASTLYGGDVEVEDEATRNAKDKERWARLRKVKSLFNTKGGKKSNRTASRPGTGHSSVQQPRQSESGRDERAAKN